MCRQAIPSTRVFTKTSATLWRQSEYDEWLEKRIERKMWEIQKRKYENCERDKKKARMWEIQPANHPTLAQHHFCHGGPLALHLKFRKSKNFLVQNWQVYYLIGRFGLDKKMQEGSMTSFSLSGFCFESFALGVSFDLMIVIVILTMKVNNSNIELKKEQFFYCWKYQWVLLTSATQFCTLF